MDSLEIADAAAHSPQLVVPPPPRQSPRARTSGPPTRSDEDTTAALIVDGLRWTVREAARGILEGVSSAALSDPAGQGWEMVKKNAAREVWRARIGGRTVFLKYYARCTLRDRLRALCGIAPCASEWRGGLFALRHDIPAARPIGYTCAIRRQNANWALLVTEAIEQARPLDEFWLSICADENARRRREDSAQLVEILAELIARAHQAGFEHVDMHAANILIQTIGPRRYRASFVDLHSARLGAPISDGAIVRNLAQLNQWFSRHSSSGARLRFLRAYFRWRNEFEHAYPHGRSLDFSFEQIVRELVVVARRHADRLWAQRDRRISRAGRYFASLRLGGGWRGVACVTSKRAIDESRASGLTLTATWWRERLREPESLFASAAERVKDSHSAQVNRVRLTHETGDLDVIAKRPLARNLQRKLRGLLGPSRARRGFEIGHALLHRDLPTARPLAALEHRSGPFLVDSVLLTEVIADAVDLSTHLRAQFAALRSREWQRHKVELCVGLANLLRRLHERGFVHRDCKAENILVRRRPLKLLWIDMDGIRRRGEVPRAAELRAIARLHVSLLACDGLTRTDRARFLREYHARFGVSPDEWRVTWRELAPRVADKLAQREQRRAWKLRHYGRT